MAKHKPYHHLNRHVQVHSNISDALKKRVAPVDKAISGFLQDVWDKGLNDKVLLVVTGEFGRTKINANAGRDHWPAITPMVMAGGDYQSGRTIGASDRSYSPIENPVGPLDLQATLAKREEKLKKKEKIIQDEIDERENREKELENIKKELASLKQLTKRQEQAIQKKDKQIQDQSEEMNGLKTLQEQIFNLSKKAKV